ncbi:MAG: YggT family protein [Chloroflexi bacterium]|nr:YggT family protein [Chloroflexota bacterium]
MTYDEERIVTRSDETRVTPAVPVAPAAPPVMPAVPATHGSGYGTTVTQERAVRRAGTGATIERLVVFVLGLVMLLIGLRVVLLLLNAREGNDLVSSIYNISEPFVAPFRGILGQEAISRGGTYLDGAALVAMVGWLIVAGVILALLRVFRREP